MNKTQTISNHVLGLCTHVFLCYVYIVVVVGVVVVVVVVVVGVCMYSHNIIV